MASEPMKLAKARFLKWARKNIKSPIRKLSHISPTCYVIGFAAPGCLIIARPWMDAEPQVRDFQKSNPLDIVRNFDRSLKPGDWCIAAYVSTDGCGESYAIPV